MPRCCAAPPARRSQDLDALLVGPDDFDPSASRQTFTIAMPDHILPMVLNGFMREFRRRAPLARLAIRALGPEYDFEGALANGTADLVISNWPTPPPDLRISVLFQDEFVCLVDPAHRFAHTPPTREDYLAADHVAPGDYAIRHRGVVETHLSALHASRERRVVTAYFSMAPYLLPGTDLVFTVTRHYAEHFARILPLAIVDSPIDYPRDPVLPALARADAALVDPPLAALAARRNLSRAGHAHGRGRRSGGRAKLAAPVTQRAARRRRSDHRRETLTGVP